MITDRKYQIINESTGNSAWFNTTRPALEWGQKVSKMQNITLVVMRKGFYFGTFTNGVLDIKGYI
tara:strand:+ start:408 stop:602 length:195 start_codon:yes stop_codon:yes gene_type:complete